MPLIALDILEGKINELTLIINHLKDENDILKKKLSSVSSGEISPEIIFELEKMRKESTKFKQERTALYAKISDAIKTIDSITENK